MTSTQISLHDYQGPEFPGTYPVTVTPETVLNLTIPSSRHYYLGTTGLRIPYLSTNIQTDVAAWLSSDDSFPRVYIKGAVDSTGDPEIDLISIIEGVRVLVPQDIRNRYLREFAGMLDQLRGAQTRESRFGLVASRRLMEDMLDYPFHEGSDFLLASRLAQQSDRDRIQDYLDERGVVHFTAEDIVNLQPVDIFFYLTRFYGPPVQGDLSTIGVQRSYSRRATNTETKEIARLLPENTVTWRTLRREFDLYFNQILQDPQNPQIWTSLGCSSSARFYRSFFSYLRLLRRPQTLPPLSLNTVKQLRPMIESSIQGLLTNYTDQEILALVGEDPHREVSRQTFLSRATEKLLERRVFILQPYEARLCNNAESITTFDEFAELNHPYLGRGSLATGFDCYTIADLFSAWESHRNSEGEVEFIDPLQPRTSFRVPDLRAFLDALQSGRRGVPVPPQIIEQLEGYIRQAETQSSADYAKIRQLRAWSQRSEQNKELMRAYWTSYFHMGMYMRQWLGPGHPYPVTKEATGSEAAVGSEREIQIASNVQRERVQFEKFRRQMPPEIRELLNSLTVMRRYQGQVESERTTLGHRYQRVIDDHAYCIRMASGPWSYSGAYYLKQILDEQIPGFDLGSNVEYIQ